MNESSLLFNYSNYSIIQVHLRYYNWRRGLWINKFYDGNCSPRNSQPNGRTYHLLSGTCPTFLRCKFSWRRQLRKIFAPSKVMIHQLRRSRNSIDLVHTRPHSNPATDVGSGKTNHAANDCKFKDAICHACGKKGHIAPVCRSMPAINTTTPPTN